MRLDKFLANSTGLSRKEVRDLIKYECVKVNEKICRDASRQVDETADEIRLKGRVVQYQKYHYLMMNKPEGVVCATEDNLHRTVLDILPEEYRKFELFPVGRLDIDTTGLLLLTNDGDFVHRVISPKKHVGKTYYAEVDGHLKADFVRQLSEGVIIDGTYKTRPAELHILDDTRCELTIYEGKFHQVKKMLLSLGCRVIKLSRLSIGGLTLDKALNPGGVRRLTPEEVEQIWTK